MKSVTETVLPIQGHVSLYLPKETQALFKRSDLHTKAEEDRTRCVQSLCPCPNTEAWSARPASCPSATGWSPPENVAQVGENLVAFA